MVAPERLKVRLPLKMPPKVPPPVEVKVPPVELVIIPPVPGRALLLERAAIATLRPLRLRTPAFAVSA